MDEFQSALYGLLQNKLFAITTARQQLWKVMTPETEWAIRNELERGLLEFLLIEAVMSMLANSQPLQLPDQAAVDQLVQTTANLAHVVQTSASADVLIGALDQAIEAWPIAA